MSIVNVKEIVEGKKVSLKREILDLRDKGIIPKLAVILANDVEASRIYVSKKRKICEEMGIDDVEYFFDENAKTEDIIELIDKLNNNNEVDGILVQLPLFRHLDEAKIIDSILPEKDVDGFSAVNVGKLYQGKPSVVPCTPKGILTILKQLEPNLSGKNAVVIGRSQIVGKPMAALLLNENMTVTLCHSKTTNLPEHTKQADIVIVATGVPHLINESMIKEGAIVIDVGMNRLNDKLVGDVDTFSVDTKAKYVTPVPGGVGLTTVLSLAQNVVELSKNRLK